MMMPSHENPAVTRVQQQHNVFRAGHQHSSSDPIHLREAAALLSSGLPQFQPGLYPPTLGPHTMGLYPNQFYPHEAYANVGVAAQVMAAARLQSQFPPQYSVGLPGQSISPGLHDGNEIGGSSADPNGNGPSANNRKLGLYKTELCRSWEEKGTCRYGPKCQFAHGEEEIRKVSRHPKVVSCSFQLFLTPIC
jgi:tristetraprolin/butyrate response factor 1